MRAKPRIVIVGAGNLGGALAVSLRRAGYVIEAIVAHSRGPSLKKAQRLAREVGSRVLVDSIASVRSALFWFCVPDGAIARSARALAGEIEWKGRVALHSSGVLASDELDALRRKGAVVAAAHPMMTFVPGSRPGLARVPFAIEGDAAAEHLARLIVQDLGGEAYPIRKERKAAYHTWGTFASPLLTALLATAEQVAAAAGVPSSEARRRIVPILSQTLSNYASQGAPGAFSGPIVRGDVDTVKRQLRVLREIPVAREVYHSLAIAALRYLPSKREAALRRVLHSAGK